MIWLASCAAAARSVRPDRRASCSWRQEGTCLARRRTGYLERPASSPVSRRTWNLPRAAHLHAQHPTPPVPCTSSLACPAPAISDQTVSSPSTRRGPPLRWPPVSLHPHLHPVWPVLLSVSSVLLPSLPLPPSLTHSHSLPLLLSYLSIRSFLPLPHPCRLSFPSLVHCIRSFPYHPVS